MSKELTENGKNGTIRDGSYYVITTYNESPDVYIATSGILWHNRFNPIWESELKEILAPVPSYDEIKRLQEQLHEANEVIDACCSLPETNWVVIDSYKEKWGVK